MDKKGKKENNQLTILSSSGVMKPSLSMSNFSNAACDRCNHFSESCSSSWCTCKVAATNSWKSTSPSVFVSICVKSLDCTVPFRILKPKMHTQSGKQTECNKAASAHKNLVKSLHNVTRKGSLPITKSRRIMERGERRLQLGESPRPGILSTSMEDP